MKLKHLQLIALLLSAVALMPAGAHFFELPNKIGLDRDDYLVVQSIYNGWALFGVVLIANLVVLAALALVARRQAKPFALVLVSFACQTATLALFFAVVFPANQATANWTAIPADWETLRLNWEYGHAVNALIAFGGFCALVVSVLSTRD
jgi:hypothetical protein